MLDSEIDIVPSGPQTNVSDEVVEAILKNKRKKKLVYAKNPKCAPIVLVAAKKLQRKKFSWKRATVKILAVVMIGVASGVMLGNWYKNYLTGMVFDYSNYNLEDYEMNSTSVLNSILGTTAQADTDFSTLTATLKQKGMTPKDLSASQNIALATFNASLAKSYSAVGLGEVATIATQDITSSKKFDGTTYTFESLSKGILTIANCAVMKKGATNVSLHKGKNLVVDSSTGVCKADWNADGENLPLKKYVELNGLEPSRLLPYVISDKTIIDEDKIVVSDAVWKDKSVFEFTITLDPVTGVLRYYRQVMQTSGLKDAPTFKDVTIKIMLDADWNFVRTEVTENYTVVYGVPAPCTGTLNTDYVFNQPVTLPIGGEA